MLKLNYLGLGLALMASGTMATAGEDQSSTQAPSSDTGHASGLFANASYEFASGVDYSAGHYGAMLDTTVWSIPFDVKAQLGRLRLQGTIPYEFIKGPGQMVGGVIVSSPGDTTTTARSGIGDVNLSAAYLMTREQGLVPAIEVGGGVKLPTAKSSIGTGKADYSLTASAYKSLTPQTMLFGSVGYSWLGSPAAYQLRNGLTATGGINFRPAQNQNYGVSVAYREPVADGYQGQAVISPYMTYRVGKTWGLTLYGMGGLNDASPRIGAGIRISIFK